MTSKYWCTETQVVQEFNSKLQVSMSGPMTAIPLLRNDSRDIRDSTKRTSTAWILFHPFGSMLYLYCTIRSPNRLLYRAVSFAVLAGFRFSGWSKLLSWSTVKSNLIHRRQKPELRAVPEGFLKRRFPNQKRAIRESHFGLFMLNKGIVMTSSLELKWVLTMQSLAICYIFRSLYRVWMLVSAQRS